MNQVGVEILNAPSPQPSPGVPGEGVRVGVVAIGRNEGERLRACLTSALAQAPTIVYVDSNSTDYSVAMAKELGVHVVELDVTTPFTAARARNAGFDRLLHIDPEVDFVQFVDGDCEIHSTWIGRAVHELTTQPVVAVVCGRRRERYRSASIYNALADMEWDTPIGQVRSCGGDALIRVEAFREVSGYDVNVIAGEEPEMCVRLREKGWKILRIDAEMTLHDAAMKEFSQWWKRSVRAGHAYAEGYAMHGRTSERHRARETKSIFTYALVLPALIILAAGFGFGLLSIIIAMIYPALLWRVARQKKRSGASRRDSWAYGASVVIGKFPQLIGMLKYAIGRLRGKRTRLIEYKGPALA